MRGSRKTTKKSSKQSPSTSRKRTPGRQAGTSLLLRDLDPDVERVLRRRAERSGRSLQQELHAALRRDANRNFEEAVAISAAWRDRLKSRAALPDTTSILREDRSR